MTARLRGDRVLQAWLDAVEQALRSRDGTRAQGGELTFCCLTPERHRNGRDGHRSATWNIAKGCGHCHACGARWSCKRVAELLVIALPQGDTAGPECQWRICDRSGRLIAVHHRIDLADGGKRFWWTDPNGEPKLGRPAAELPLYGSERLNGYDQSRPVIVCEGEKAADALVAVGVQAVATVTGASSCPSSAVLADLSGFAVVCWDNARDGEVHMRKVATDLLGGAASIATLPQPLGAQPKDYAHDYVRRSRQRGLSDEQIRARIERAAATAPSFDAKRSNGEAIEATGKNEDGARGQGRGTGDLRLVRASSLKVERPVWVWRDRVPEGGCTMFAGLEGLGKTLLALTVAARLTRGQLDGDRIGRPGHVIYIGHEDGWEAITLPRLVAAGADLDRVHFVALSEGRVFSVERDLGSLLAALEALDDVVLVIIDPLDAHLGDTIDSHRKSEVQRAVLRLAELAQARRCAVMGIGHLRKDELTADVLVRIIGSKGFTTGPRSVLAVGPHPDNDRERLLVLAKANFTDKATVPALRFRIDGAEVPHEDGGTIQTAAVVWLGEEHGVDPNIIMTVPSVDERTEREAAADWLRELLATGESIAYEKVERMAKATGIARATLHRARELAGAVVERDESARGRPSTWRLPVSSPSLSLNRETKSNGNKIRGPGPDPGV